ncbi:MAG TPA: hypothetical protein DEQ09_10305 [Bacteroidales bacterium]|nr:hypothetical protein [Bacteroidales bacterium]
MYQSKGLYFINPLYNKGGCIKSDLTTPGTPHTDRLSAGLSNGGEIWKKTKSDPCVSIARFLYL